MSYLCSGRSFKFKLYLLLWFGVVPIVKEKTM